LRVALAEAALARRDRKTALASLEKAEPRLEAEAAPEGSWLWQARLYERAGTCPAAERAAKRAGVAANGADVLARCRKAQRPPR
jgi:Tfp pilus assembly protein PilF